MKNRFFILMLIATFVLPLIVLADSGPKPSIDLKIENLETTNYIVDLFVYDSDGQAYTAEMDYNGGGLSDEQIRQLYELNYDGWISESTRWGRYLLFADCAGNARYMHNFSYFGTPDRYKVVIINDDNGEIKVSDEIIRKEFNSFVTIDYNTMKEIVDNNTNKTIIIGIAVLFTTIAVELGIAFIFKTSNYKIIALTNLITNLGLQAALITFTSHYMLTFIIGELIVIAGELLTYLLTFKKVSKTKIISYGIVANLVTILFTFLMYRI